MLTAPPPPAPAHSPPPPPLLQVSTMFALQARTCPPWREKRAMMNKWLTTAVIDEALDQDQEEGSRV